MSHLLDTQQARTRNQPHATPEGALDTTREQALTETGVPQPAVTRAAHNAAGPPRGALYSDTDREVWLIQTTAKAAVYSVTHSQANFLNAAKTEDEATHTLANSPPGYSAFMEEHGFWRWRVKAKEKKHVKRGTLARSRSRSLRD